MGEGPFCMERHAHNQLEEIFQLAWDHGAIPRGSLLDLVIRAVAFH